MTAYPKLPNKPECLGFRKTIVLNYQEYLTGNLVLKNAIEIFRGQNDPRGDDMANVCQQILEKLHSPTPPPN